MDPYKKASEAINRDQRELSGRVGRSIFRRAAQFIDSIVAKLKTSRSPSAVEKTVEDSAKAFSTEVSSDIEQGLYQSVDSTLRVWKRSSEEYAQDSHIDLSTLGLLHNPLVTIAIIGSLGSLSQWRTLIWKYAQNSATEIIAVIRGVLRTRGDPDALARLLRPYVLGSERFAKRFSEFPTEAGPIDLRGAVPGDVRGSASQMVFNSTRIAFTEIHHARSVAEIKVFLADPFVYAVKWTLSKNRGNWTPPDECDLLAGIDFYGLGPGAYPLRKVPRTPHPFDRCERIPLVRRTPMAPHEKPDPHAIRSPLDNDVEFPRGSRLSPRAAYLARQSALTAIQNPVGI